MASCARVENEKPKGEERIISLLDLPKLILDCILERLSLADLFNMMKVCSSLRETCTSDHLWEKHFQRKWGRVIGDAAYREWRSHVSSMLESNLPKPLFDPLLTARHLSWIRTKPETSGKVMKSTTLSTDSVMAFYFALENGKFWFPAQVYYRQNGYTGVLLLCYDAEVNYVSQTDTFRARNCSNGWGPGEENNVEWDRVRVPPLDVPPFMPHVSDCLHDLKPGDHIEIQWKSRTDLPFAWWYARIGHLGSCDGNQNHCLCHESDRGGTISRMTLNLSRNGLKYTPFDRGGSDGLNSQELTCGDIFLGLAYVMLKSLLADTVIVEFNQYPPGSRWRRTTTSRKHHPREGNTVDGFYGEIRKLSDEETAKWLTFWPNGFLIRVRFPYLQQ